MTDPVTIEEGNVFDPPAPKKPGRPFGALDGPTSLRKQNEIEVLKAIDECGGDKTAAAKKLGIGRKTVYRVLERANEDQRQVASRTVSLKAIRKQLERLVAGLAEKVDHQAREATMRENVDALVKLIPVLRGLAVMTSPQKPEVEGMVKTLTERAKFKVAQRKSAGNGNVENGTD